MVKLCNQKIKNLCIKDLCVSDEPYYFKIGNVIITICWRVAFCHISQFLSNFEVNMDEILALGMATI